MTTFSIPAQPQGPLWTSDTDSHGKFMVDIWHHSPRLSSPGGRADVWISGDGRQLSWADLLRLEPGDRHPLLDELPDGPFEPDCNTVRDGNNMIFMTVSHPTRSNEEDAVMAGTIARILNDHVERVNAS
jgi:hypothetical protein